MADDIEETTPAGVTRRSITTAAAWSVPVVALTAMTPTAAATTPLGTISFSFDANGQYSANGKYAGAYLHVDFASGQSPVPVVVAMTYPSGVTGPATFSFSTGAGYLAQLDGIYDARDYRSEGLVTASAEGFDTGSTSPLACT